VPGQILAVPEIVVGTAGVSGFTDTAKVFAALVPQLFFALTLMFPLPEVPAVTSILLVILVPVHPPGKVHSYSEAPGTAVIENVWLIPGHKFAVPEIVPGTLGVPFRTFTANVCAALVPQSFFAFTVIEPLPVLPEVTVIDSLVLFPDQPEGNVHSYEVAFTTEAME